MNINKAIQSAFENHQTGNLKQAELLCNEILREEPDNADILRLLGAIRYQFKNYSSAIACFKKAIDIDPADTFAYYNLGILMHEKGNLDEAIEFYEKTIQLNSSFTEAYYNLGIAFQEKEEFNEAVKYYHKALECNPGYADAYYNLGTILKEQGALPEAVTFYDKAIVCRPHYALALWARCMSHLAVIYQDQESIRNSREKYHADFLKLQSALSLQTPQDIEVAGRAVGSQTPFLLACQGLNDRELQSLYGKLVCKIMALRYPQFAKSLHMPRRLQGEKLRVGIVSGFFYWHSIWKIPLGGWVENIDRKRFSLYGYYTGKVKENITEGARQYFSNFVEDIYSVEELGQIIRNDNLHVLIYPEIGMDPMTVRLAALSLAPVQCTSLGHPVTSGLPTIDYYLSSDLMEPSNAGEHYTEELIRLPNLGFYYTPFEVAPVDISRKTFGLQQESVLYLCSHSLFTYLPEYDEAFPRIAGFVGNCRFLFISNKSRLITEQFRLRLSKVFDRFNLNANDFIVFLPRLDQKQYHALNCMADIFLDSIGWSANNSTFEAIACNLPVVTFPGTLMRQRHCAAILTMMQMRDTIAESFDEYIEMAARLGKDKELRDHVSNKIAENKRLIYYDRTCISDLEEFLEKAVRERQ